MTVDENEEERCHDACEIYMAERANPCDFCTAPFNGDPEHDSMICLACRGNPFR